MVNVMIDALSHIAYFLVSLSYVFSPINYIMFLHCNSSNMKKENINDIFKVKTFGYYWNLLNIYFSPKSSYRDKKRDL